MINTWLRHKCKVQQIHEISTNILSRYVEISHKICLQPVLANFKLRDNGSIVVTLAILMTALL